MRYLSPLFAFYETANPNGFYIFMLCTIGLGGWAAFVSGRAIAETWRPFWQVVGYALLLALVVRFMHFSLFEEKLLSLRNYLVDCTLLLVASTAGYLLARSRQKAEMYPWLKSR